MARKTNAIRLIEQAKIPCKEFFYDYDENDLNGNIAAKAIGYPPEQVFKTLVTKGDRNGIQIFCIPVCCELDLKKAAAVTGDKSIALVPAKNLLQLTGYIRGGCSPVGMKKKYPTYIDEVAQLYEEIAISAGERGHQVVLPPEDLIQLINANICNIIH